MQTALSTLPLGGLADWDDSLALPRRWVTPRPADPGPRAKGISAVPADSTPELDDATWIARVQEGDEDAAEALVQRLYPTILKSVRCHLPRRTAEEDLVQAVFVKIFTKLGQFSGLVPLEHWVSRIAINTCLNQFKYESVRPELRMGDLSEEEEAVVQHLVSSNEALPGERSSAARELLEKLLTRLKPDERMVITLLHLEERSSEDVSRMTGWSISLVKVKAFRARQKMRRLWKTLLSGQE
jgi:RNA polymerase sigma-70 factor (ECF subfamily)